MSESYIVTTIVYDWYHAFELLKLACDQTYRLAMAICKEYKQYVTETGIEENYDTLNQFLFDKVSFKETWSKICNLPDTMVY